MKHFVYSFNEGSKDMRSLLGGKGANLAEMTKIGLPVPFGFTITTEACNEYYRNGGKLGEELISEIKEKLSELENVTGKTSCFCKIRIGILYAGNDGYHSQLRPKRRVN